MEWWPQEHSSWHLVHTARSGVTHGWPGDHETVSDESRVCMSDLIVFLLTLLHWYLNRDARIISQRARLQMWNVICKNNPLQAPAVIFWMECCLLNVIFCCNIFHYIWYLMKLPDNSHNFVTHNQLRIRLHSLRQIVTSNCVTLTIHLHSNSE